MRIGKLFGAVFVCSLAVGADRAAAATTCGFTIVGTTMQLNANCVTDAPLIVPDGVTLDGRGRTITAVDPPGDHFRGAVIIAGGAVAHIRNVTVTASGLADVCDIGDDRLRGIFFNGASGSIRDVTVLGLHQALPTGCAEGSGIIVNKLPADGTHPATAVVTIDRVSVLGVARVGLQGFGDVALVIRDSQVRGLRMADIQSEVGLDQIGIFLAGGARGRVVNTIVSQTWDGDPDRLAYGVDIREASDVRVADSSISGGTYGATLIGQCQFTGEASHNAIERSWIRAARQGVVLAGFGNPCMAQVNGNRIAGNDIGSAAGFTALDGIFVGIGAPPAEVDGNVIVGNRVRGTVNGIVRSGDTNTVVRGNVIVP